MAEQEVPAPVSSKNPIWETYVQQGTELRAVAHRNWKASQKLGKPCGYTGVEDMITITNNLSIPPKVVLRLQAMRMTFLKALAQWVMN
jgi:hypothetical protein